MAVIEVSVNLSSSIFPFATEMWGRSIMIGKEDENYNKTVFSTIDPGFEKQQPQVFYMHNVMPQIQGYQSISYDNALPSGNPASGAFGEFIFGVSGFGVSTVAVTIFDKVFELQTINGNNFLFVPAGGANFIYDASVGAWQSIDPITDGSVNTTTQVTTAFIQGETYIYYANKGCYKYNDVTKHIVPVTLVGLTATQIVSICAANGYMIAASKNAIAWSSLVNPLDFTPSLVTGAGGGQVSDAKGSIVCALQISGGFIIYCTQNAVGATFTGNSSFPFILLEVAASGGITSPDRVSWSANTATHYTFGSHDIQELSKATAKAALPEASDFLASKLFEDFDEATLTFNSQYLSNQVASKVVMIASRYIVLSYGITAGLFTHALIYDLTLKRWGKAKIDHTACFEWNSPNLFGALTYGQLNNTTYGQLIATTYGNLNTQMTPVLLPKKLISFLQQDGTVKIMNFDLSEATSNGVLVIGKFQVLRRRWLEHQYGLLDNVLQGNTFNYYILATHTDGKTLRPAVLGKRNTKLSGPKVAGYQRIVSGQSISPMFIGAFSLSSFVLGVTLAGNR